MDIDNVTINEYIDEILPMLGGDVGLLQERGYNEAYPVIRKATASFLATLVSALKPKEILEIGCAIGFSASLMSSVMAESGHITTIDRYGVMIEQAKLNFTKLGLNDRITLLEGDAGKILPELNKQFDFIFLDAAKGQYMNFLPHCLRLLKVGGVFLADDIFQNGYVAMDRFDVPRRHRTTHKRMREFIYTLTHAKGLQSALIPCDHGLIMCTKTMDEVILDISDKV
jgi:predicted O-methyltransferase YrrM